MSKNNAIESLKIVLADSYALYLKTQNYHWNVTGSNFKSLHELFELQYTDLAAAIDLIAERIRSLGHKVKADFAHFSKLTSIECGDDSLKAEEMVKQLATDQSKIVKSLYNALHVYEELGDESTVDLMIERISTHEKNAWMLNSSLK